MSYIGNSPGNASQRVVTRKVATAGQTRFASDSGYATGYVDVIVNGSDLVAGVDFNETGDGINIDLVEPCAADDNVKIVAYIPRGLSDGYTKPEANALLALKADLVAGKIPSSQLPAYVDDVLEYANLAAFPATGSAGIIYVAQDTNNCYRWSGSAYIVLTDLSAYYTKTQSDAKYVGKDSSTGAALMPVGTTAQRPDTPVTGMYRMNSTLGIPEWFDVSSSSWVSFSEGIPYSVDYLVVAGGGGGSGFGGGGGGAGGYLSSVLTFNKGNNYSVIVGAGGAGGNGYDGAQRLGTSGSNSSINSLAIAIGGGFSGNDTQANGVAGGSGGGAGTYGSPTGVGGAGTSGQGNKGGDQNGQIERAGGGGGAGNYGFNGNDIGGRAGDGGVGRQWLNGSYYAGGGGGGCRSSAGASGGNGGNGGGGRGSDSSSNNCVAGTANTGGGGGGAQGYPAGTNASGMSGGSGIVIIRYIGAQRGTGGTVTSSGGYTYHTFTSSGTFTA